MLGTEEQMLQTDDSRRIWVCANAFSKSIHKCFLARL